MQKFLLKAEASEGPREAAVKQPFQKAISSVRIWSVLG